MNVEPAVKVIETITMKKSCESTRNWRERLAVHKSNFVSTFNSMNT